MPEEEKDKQNKFSFGTCHSCKRFRALMNGVCVECKKKEEKIEMPDFLKDIFGGF